MKRLFTFGCSFTQYAWPTWANILANEYDSFENWGMCGGGNQFIFNSIVECLNKHSLTQNDTIVVMWTDLYRQDGYTNYNWHRFGNFLNQEKYQKFLDVYDFRGLVVRDLALIDAAKRLLDGVGCSYQFHSMVPITHLVDKDDITDILNLYKNTLNFIKPSVFEVLTNNLGWKTLPTPVDYNYYQRYSSITEIKKLKKKYYELAGPSWPRTFEDYINNTSEKIPKNILEEIEQYNFKKLFFKSEQKKLLPSFQKDYHPTPIDHLRYVLTAFKEINISENTISWVNDAQKTIQSGEIFEFNENLPNRI